MKMHASNDVYVLGSTVNTSRIFHARICWFC